MISSLVVFPRLGMVVVPRCPTNVFLGIREWKMGRAWVPLRYGATAARQLADVLVELRTPTAAPKSMFEL
jgi:hypothetical protein